MCGVCGQEYCCCCPFCHMTPCECSNEGDGKMMNKLTITIDMKNDAFDDTNLEAVRILERVTFMLRNNYNMPATLNDINGNKVAKIEIE